MSTVNKIIKNQVAYRILSALAIISFLLIPIHGEVLGGSLFIFILMGLTGGITLSLSSIILIIAILSLVIGLFIKIPIRILYTQYFLIYLGLLVIYYLMINDPTTRIKPDTIITSALFFVFSVISLAIQVRSIKSAA